MRYINFFSTREDADLFPITDFILFIKKCFGSWYVSWDKDNIIMKNSRNEFNVKINDIMNNSIRRGNSVAGFKYYIKSSFIAEILKHMGQNEGLVKINLAFIEKKFGFRDVGNLEDKLSKQIEKLNNGEEIIVKGTDKVKE